MRIIIRVGYQVAKVYWWITRPRTIGVRVIAHDGNNMVLLVRHTYGRRREWYLPGGGVKRGETLHAAAIRELREEAGATVGGGDDAASLLGVYSNFRDFKSDYIATFVVTDWTMGSAKSFEIAECKLFPASELPEHATEATRQRIAEWLGESQIRPRW